MSWYISKSHGISIWYNHRTIPPYYFIRTIEKLLRSLSARWWVWVMSRQTAMRRTCAMFETQQYTWTAPLEQLRSPDMLIIKRASMAPPSHLHGNSRGQSSGWHQVADRRNIREREQDTERQIKTERGDFGSSYVCAWVLNQVCPIPQRKPNQFSLIKTTNAVTQYYFSFRLWWLWECIINSSHCTITWHMQIGCCFFNSIISTT